MSSQRYRPNQQLEIYNFRVVPGLQISKEVDFNDLYNIICIFSVFHIFVFAFSWIFCNCLDLFTICQIFPEFLRKVEKINCCHERGAIEVSRAVNGTDRTAKTTSTILEWSQGFK